MAQFEFSAEHDREFLATAYWMGIVGGLAMVAGVLRAIGGALQIADGLPGQAWPDLLGGLVIVVLGFFANRVAGSFRAIATSQGHDLDHLMVAVVALKRLFLLVTVGIFALLLLAFAAGIVLGMLGSAA